MAIDVILTSMLFQLVNRSVGYLRTPTALRDTARPEGLIPARAVSRGIARAVSRGIASIGLCRHNPPREVPEYPLSAGESLYQLKKKSILKWEG